MKRLITGLFIFLIGVTAAHAASGSLMFAATEMPKPDPCLPFIGQTSSWLNENFSGGVKFEYYERKELEKAIRDGKVDIILSEPEKPQDWENGERGRSWQPSVFATLTRKGAKVPCSLFAMTEKICQN